MYYVWIGICIFLCIHHIFNMEGKKMNEKYSDSDIQTFLKKGWKIPKCTSFDKDGNIIPNAVKPRILFQHYSEIANSKWIDNLKKLKY